MRGRLGVLSGFGLASIGAALLGGEPLALHDMKQAVSRPTAKRYRKTPQRKKERTTKAFKLKGIRP
jgi:hypothetical protein